MSKKKVSGMLLGITGLLIVIYFCGWAALGVFLAIWGNNLERF